ncbi:MAG: efflux RND transporter periplasmic adaptor subunit [Myxococcales bacterium]|nr:efflux RND transporter periplasmic adaptor subunit [Myxococcales bacterium]
MSETNEERRDGRDPHMVPAQGESASDTDGEGDANLTHDAGKAHDDGKQDAAAQGTSDAEPPRVAQSAHTERHVAAVTHDEPSHERSLDPPRGPSLSRIVGWGVAVLVVLAIGHSFGDTLLSPIRSAWAALGSGHAAEEPVAEVGTYYTCGMHPWVVLPAPGDCPICHMKLTPLDPAKFTGEITIDPVVTQNIGVRVAPVVSGPLTRTIRTVGKVDYDETTVRDINTRVDGWLEKLYVDYVGAKVEAGQPLFDLFSRELYSAQEEYLIAYRSLKADTPDVGFVSQVGRDTRSNLEAVRRRLQLFGIGDDQIASLERDGVISQTMTITSPWSGLVTEKHAFDGMRVTPGMLTYRIADLSRVWVFVTLYEYQLPFVQTGQTAIMTLPYIPGQNFEGKVTYIYPWLEEKTREVRVRIEFANPDMLLKPGMFATVELQGLLSDDRTLVPRESVIDTGERQIAFVSKGAGSFEPRDVRMGVQADDGMVEVISGLKPGEIVVTSGQFLLDSEARIREALAKMIRGDLASEQERAAVISGASELESLPSGMATDLASILDSYFAIGAGLAVDSLDDSGSAAHEIGTRVDALLAREVPGRPHFWHQHEEIARVRGFALEFAKAGSIADARESFGDLSVALSALLRATGVPPDYPSEVRELHCPMFREGQGGSSWLQPVGEVRNPFFGPVMLGCFDREFGLPVTGSGGHAANATGPSEPMPSHTSVLSEPDDGSTVPAARGDTADSAASSDELLAAYLAITGLLVADEGGDLATQFDALADAAERLGRSLDPEIQRLASEVTAAARPAPTDLVTGRAALARISPVLSELVQRVAPSIDVAPSLYEAYCPMAHAPWLQIRKQVANPYYGQEMLDCGSIRKTIRVDTTGGTDR